MVFVVRLDSVGFYLQTCSICFPPTIWHEHQLPTHTLDCANTQDMCGFWQLSHRFLHPVKSHERPWMHVRDGGNEAAISLQKVAISKVLPNGTTWLTRWCNWNASWCSEMRNFLLLQEEWDNSSSCSGFTLLTHSWTRLIVGLSNRWMFAKEVLMWCLRSIRVHVGGS